MAELKSVPREVSQDGMIYCRAGNAKVRAENCPCRDCPLKDGENCRYYETGEPFPDYLAPGASEEEKLIQRALNFAAKAHEGVRRKGSEVPYFLHPMEAAMLCRHLTEDANVIAAAALHDVVEDTPYTRGDLEREFGPVIAELVAHESEDKMRHMSAADSWRIRKEAALAHFAEAPRDAKMIALCDKLSNMRMSVRTYRKKGPAMWQVFNMSDVGQQEWYYRSIAEAVKEFSDSPLWQEYKACCDEVFGGKQ